MQGVYCIENMVTGFKYVGQSSNIEGRLTTQKNMLKRDKITQKSVNTRLYYDVQRYGIENFRFYVLEEMPLSTRKEREVAERKWMIALKTFADQNGYNLRSDSGDGMVAHDYTRTLQSLSSVGEDNPNFGNRWSDEQCNRMSEIAKERHRSGKYYGDEWRKRNGEKTRRFWSENPDVKKQMSEKVALKKIKYRFHQYTKSGEFIRTWDSMMEITREHPDFHVQAIYSVCDGNKSSYRGFVWKKELKI